MQSTASINEVPGKVLNSNANYFANAALFAHHDVNCLSALRRQLPSAPAPHASRPGSSSTGASCSTVCLLMIMQSLAPNSCHLIWQRDTQKPLNIVDASADRLPQERHGTAAERYIGPLVNGLRHGLGVLSYQVNNLPILLDISVYHAAADRTGCSRCPSSAPPLGMCVVCNIGA